MLGAIASLVSPARLAIEPIRPRGKQLRFGAAVRGLDLSAPLDDAEVRLLSEALAEHGLLLLKGAAPAHVDPHAFVSLMRRLNPGEDLTIWRDQATNPWERHKAERMGPAGTFQLPDCREVLVIGKGELRDHWGLSCALGGARAAYGNSSGSQVIGGGALQWHIDGAMWASPATRASGLPCRTVGMRCVEAPAAEDGGLRLFDVDYGDGSRVGCAAGSTAFCSGATAFSLLTPPERRRALRTTVIYAAHPFKRFAKCSMTKDGLRCVGGADVETPLDDDGGDDDGDGGGGGGETRGSLRLPLVWASRATGRLALMPHTRCVEALEIAPGDADDEGASQQTVVLGTEEARHYLHGLMRRAVEPQLVYALGWEAGDCGVWNNREVWHSATGGLREHERRVMHLVAFDGAEPPSGPDGYDDDDASATAAASASCTASARPRPSVLALIIGQTPRDDLVVPLREALPPRGTRQDGGRKEEEEEGLKVRGALDGVMADDGDATGLFLRPDAAEAAGDGAAVEASDCPLITRLRDGRQVTVREASLTPLLQQQLDEHAAALAATAGGAGRGGGGGCDCDCVAVLLCAGQFEGLRPPEGVRLIRPFEVAAASAAALGVRDALLCVPTAAQAAYAIARWRPHLPAGAVLSTHVLAEEPDEEALRDAATAASASGSALILDFVGHDAGVARRLRQLMPAGATVIDVGGAALAAAVVKLWS